MRGAVRRVRGAAATVLLAAGAATAQEPAATAPAAAAAPAADDAPTAVPDAPIELTDEELIFLRKRLVTTAARRPQEIGRSSAATIVVTADAIRQSGAQTLAEVLRFVAGITTMRLSAGDAVVNIRGLNTPGNPELMLLIDGRPAPMEFFGVTLWDHLPVPLEHVDRIEIIRGPASPLYGANAFSGVINVITQTPGDTPHAAAHVTAGARDAVRATGQVRGRTGPWGVAAALSYDRTDGFSNRVSSAFLAVNDPLVLANRGTRPGREDLRSMVAVEYTGVPGVTLSASAGWVRAADVDLLTSDTTWTAENADDFYGRLQAHGDGGDFGAFHIDAWLRRTRLPASTVFPLPIAPFTFPLSETIVNDVFEIQAQRILRPFDANTFTVGGAWRVSWIHGRAVFGDAERVTVGSLFLQDEYALLPTLDLSLGLRWDVHTTAGDSASPRASLVWAPRPGHTWRLAAGQAYRNPNHAQNFASLNVGSPTVYSITGDPGLDAERQSTVQLDYETTALPDVILEVSGFYERAEDLIVFVPPPTTQPDNYDNVGNADLWGGELQCQWRAAPWLRVWGNYGFNWVRGAFEGVSPKHQGNLGLRATWNDRWSAGLSVHAQGRTRYVGPAAVPERETPGYVWLRARVAYAYQQGEIAATVGGALHRHHQEFPRGAEVPWEGGLTLSYRF